MLLLSCENITMGYEGSVVIKNISFELMQGDYFCILGENGAGKSTLMTGILGLNKIISGKFTFHNMSQRDIGYLPQQSSIQKDFPTNVFEVVLSGCLNKQGLFPFYTKKDKQRAESNIALLDISNLKKKTFADLSGGQKQRVLLARALCASEKILLLDEPVAGLDPIITNDLYHLVSKINKEQNLTIIMISHDIKSALKYGNKILHLQQTHGYLSSASEYPKTEIGKKMIGCDRCD